jgi:hypothetical protein
MSRLSSRVVKWFFVFLPTTETRNPVPLFRRPAMTINEVFSGMQSQDVYNPFISICFSLAWKLHLLREDYMKEEKAMKTRETAKQAAYIGAGAGLVGFALVGLLPGSFLGGVIGLNIAGALMVGISMLLGVFVSALMFVSASSIAGWLIGLAVDSLKADRAVPAEAKH